MTKIEELIAKHCPNGVEFKTLGEIGVFVRGNGLQKKDFVESGYPCIHYGQIYTYYGMYADKTKSFVSQECANRLRKAQKGDLIIATTSENIEDVCKSVVWIGDTEVVFGGHSSLFKHNQNSRYIAHYFKTNQFFDEKKKYARGAKVIEISTTNLAKIQIPVPSLEVQEEIARILDNFTELEAELEKTLEAELEARRKQYEYHRNKLLSFSNLSSGGGITALKP